MIDKSWLNDIYKRLLKGDKSARNEYIRYLIRVDGCNSQAELALDIGLSRARIWQIAKMACDIAKE